MCDWWFFKDGRNSAHLNSGVKESVERKKVEKGKNQRIKFCKRTP